MACGSCFVLPKRDSSSPRPVDQLSEGMSAQPGSGRLSLGKDRRRALQSWIKGKGLPELLEHCAELWGKNIFSEVLVFYC